MTNLPNAVANNKWTRPEAVSGRYLGISPNHIPNCGYSPLPFPNNQQTTISTIQVLVIQNRSSRLRRALKEQGCVVDTAANAAEADRKARSVKYGLVVLDMTVLGRDGLTLITNWRMGGMNGHVLILASLYSLEDKIEAFDAGADFLVMEPYDLNELLAQIRAVLRRTQPSRNGVRQIYDLEIDTSARTVKRAGRTIALTRNEYALLLYLAGNCGKVVTRSEIWQHLHGEDEEMTSNVVDVAIHTLRVKIDKEFEVRLSRTCWGIGYMLLGDS
jgi:DNA-binding response OmpR family regulator